MKIIYGIYKKVLKYRSEGKTGNDIFLSLVEDYKPYMTKPNNPKKLGFIKEKGFINITYMNQDDGTRVEAKIKV